MMHTEEIKLALDMIDRDTSGEVILMGKHKPKPKVEELKQSFKEKVIISTVKRRSPLRNTEKVKMMRSSSIGQQETFREVNEGQGKVLLNGQVHTRQQLLDQREEIIMQT